VTEHSEPLRGTIGVTVLIYCQWLDFPDVTVMSATRKARTAIAVLVEVWFGLIHLTSMKTDGQSQIEVHTDERNQVHSAQSSLVVTHPRTT